MERSLSERIPEYIFSRVHQDIGEASMCWHEPPLGIYDTARASKIAFDLCHFIADELERKESR